MPVRPAPPPPPTHAAERAAAWLDARRGRALLVLTAVLLLLRGLYLAELLHSPFADQHRWVNSDMSFFDDWARDIASGDLASLRVGHPHHGWHRRAAEVYFSRIPGERERWTQAGRARGIDAADALWDAWYGGPRFHQEPLYAYGLAAVHAMSGGTVWPALVLQSLCGAGAVLLLLLFVRRRFGAGAAWCAALLAAFYGPPLFFEGVLLRDSLLFAATTALLFLADRTSPADRPAVLLGTGACLGAAILLKSTFAPFGALAVAVAWSRMPPGQRLRALWMAAGLGLALVPALVRNLYAGAPPLSLSSVGVATFVNSNSPAFRPETGDYFDLDALARVMPAAHDSFLSAAARTVGLHENVSGWLVQVLRKLAAVFQRYEHPDNASFYFYREHIPVLSAAAIDFALVCALALPGMLARRRAGVLLWGAVILALAPLLVFHSNGRLRLPLAAALLPFAGIGLFELVRAFSRPWTLRPWLWTAAVAAVVLAMSRPRAESVPFIRFADYIQPWNLRYAPLAAQAQQAGDPARAAAIVDEALKYRPDFLNGWNRCYRNDHPEAARISGWFADLYARQASLWQSAGNVDRAAAAAHSAAALRAPCGRADGG